MLIDNFGRTVTYLRLSVTDRCDFRCHYCMTEKMKFLHRKDILSTDEILLIAKTFVKLGVSKIRITGGEPLIRHNLCVLLRSLKEISGLEELTLSTNGSRLQYFSKDLFALGIKRINVSLDSLRADRFKKLTRNGKLQNVLKGIDAALEAGLKIKLNSVILRNQNADEVLDLVGFAVRKNINLSLIEEMPLGIINSHDREQQFISSDFLRKVIKEKYDLKPDMGPVNRLNNQGPSRYWKIAGTLVRIGFISPHSENFCASCNRVRLTAAGKLLLCLGDEKSINLNAIIKKYPNDEGRLEEAIINSLSMKPECHHFNLSEPVQIVRFMNVTGG